ncbi:Peroxiredoxin OsmC [Aquimixticola soesokkakensis]|uniref:Peroxiredoxin OsmC n=1 Tax=Aquimixticola soesokkakensis TaxID=1519096 RepID=A0A1Y5S1B8_9RHOB|nr:OsmC family peroxiredoxin [Aquimixticola soesokkakensis]SLN30381.1 Peroxiredoxin OsmC [Aquimixticola soesokkakensis]
MITKHGSAIWQGNLKEGTGKVSTQSGALSSNPYGFNTRFDGQPGTNPEELIGAAHAACFSMALSNILSGKGIKVAKVETTSTISLSMDDGPKIVKAHLDVSIQSDGDEDTVMACAKEAETGCPVSAVLSCEITMDAKVSAA